MKSGLKAGLSWSASVGSLSSNGHSSSQGNDYTYIAYFEKTDFVPQHRWLAWTCDAIDFFCVALSVTNLERTFGKTAHDITTAITLTLLFRSLGAVRVAFQTTYQLMRPQTTQRLPSVSFLTDMVANGLWSPIF